MSRSMHIRNATPEDHPALHDLLTQSWTRNWAPHVSAASVERFRSEDPVSAYLSGHWPAMMVAEDAGRVLGMLHLVGEMIASLHVAPDAQDKGVGSKLMDVAESMGAAVLEVRAFNTRAIRFYEKRGWHAVRRYDGDEFGTALATIEMRLASPVGTPPAP